MSQSGLVHLENCTIKRATDKAFLVVYDESEYWIPRSQIANESDLEEGDDDVTVSATEWIVEQKNIEIPE